MINIKITCTRCNHESRLTPISVGGHAPLSRQLNNFYVFNTIIEPDILVDYNLNFGMKLVRSKRLEEVQQILDNEVEDNLYIDLELKELRIDCRNCNEYIVLTEIY